MLIGLVGKAGSGKDTVCDIIERLFGHDQPVTRIAFADLMKLSMANSLGMDTSCTSCWQEKIELLKTDGEIHVKVGNGTMAKISGRQFLQYYGVEGHRNTFGQDFWVDQILPPIRDIDFAPLSQAGINVITDCRFSNEADRIIEYGGWIWHLEGEDKLPSEEASHSSEGGIDPSYFHFTIKNDGDLDALEEEITKTMLYCLMKQYKLTQKDIMELQT